MNLDISSLPDNPDDIKEVISLLIRTHDEKERSYQQEIAYLKEQVRLLRNEIFGRKTEKRYLDTHPAHIQLGLFTDPEATLPVATPEDEIAIPAHKRKKPGRKPLPDDLPRIDVIHELTEEQRQCECGCLKKKIGEETSERLDIIPAKMRVFRHIRYKYACKNCEGVESQGPTVVIAPPPAEIIPKGIATAGLVAHILTAKFEDALPFYRQEKIFQRMGIDLSRATMCGWAIKAANACEPLMDLLAEQIRSGPMQIDETPVQVMKEPGRANTTQSYMWVYRGGTRAHPVLIFHYHPTRSGQVPFEFLDGYKGYVQTDGYKGYDGLLHHDGIVLLGCWSHARRNFVKVIDAKPNPKKAGLAEEALSLIGKLYGIEDYARKNDFIPDQIYPLRQEQSKPILKDIKTWLDHTADKTPPKGLLGKAVNYALKNWDRLTRYVEDGRLEIDNNRIENAIRPFALGRKNWLFAGHPDGAKAAGNIFSLIETAKANGQNPYFYLRYLFEHLPLAKTREDYINLLPQFVDPTLTTAIPA